MVHCKKRQKCGLTYESPEKWIFGQAMMLCNLWEFAGQFLSELFAKHMVNKCSSLGGISPNGVQLRDGVPGAGGCQINTISTDLPDRQIDGQTDIAACRNVRSHLKTGVLSFCITLGPIHSSYLLKTAVARYWLCSCLIHSHKHFPIID